MPTSTVSIPEPRFAHLGALSVAGLSRHYPFEKVADIPDQWQSFVPLIARLANQTKPVTYGVIYNGTDVSFDYLTGVAVASNAPVPPQMVRLDLAPQTYAVFEHAGHVATVRDTCSAIWSDWLPDSGRSAVEAPWFERYGERFDPQTGNGGLEVWIPVS